MTVVRVASKIKAMEPSWNFKMVVISKMAVSKFQNQQLPLKLVQICNVSSDGWYEQSEKDQSRNFQMSACSKMAALRYQINEYALCKVFKGFVLTYLQENYIFKWPIMPNFLNSFKLK